MIRIRSERFIKNVEVEGVTKAYVVAEIDCDTASDLPEVDEISGRLLAMGSIAWDISTGDFYGLNSGGVWNNQGGSSSDSMNARVNSLFAPNSTKSVLLKPGEKLDTDDDFEFDEKGEENDSAIQYSEDI